ncbi:MAG: hypothetical protein ACO4AU_13090 [bacterium]|jgi:hypothetical protein
MPFTKLIIAASLALIVVCGSMLGYMLLNYDAIRQEVVTRQMSQLNQQR